MPSSDIGILAVDPGKLTGVAFLRWTGVSKDSPEIIETAEVDEIEFSGFVERVLAQKSQFTDFKVVCEQFTINLQTAKKSQAPFSLEQIGVLKYLCRKADIDTITMQSPADAKNMFPNPKLKKLEIWHKGGEGHALDALRHGLLLLVKSKWVPTALFEE